MLTGRYISIHILPFSFQEYIRCQDDVSRKDLLFSSYLDNGGMPGIIHMPELSINGYIREIISNIIQKDVLIRHKWRNEAHFFKTTAFLFDSIGSIISPKKITNTLKSNNNLSISHNTVENFIKALVDSYLFYQVKRFDLKGKSLLLTQEKYYTVDVGLKKYFLEEKTNLDLGHNLENIVFLELLRRGYKINIGKANGTEIDFVVRNANGEQEYIQVAWTAKEQATFEREIRPFGLIKDFYRRVLLTTDVEPQTAYKGIQKINVIDWLLVDS